MTGDGWEKAKRSDPTLDRDKVLQEISGIVKLPKVYDSIEIDSFFPPIDFFKRDDGSIVEIDYNSYENS